jgi:hypothetical protein
MEHSQRTELYKLADRILNRACKEDEDAAIKEIASMRWKLAKAGTREGGEVLDALSDRAAKMEPHELGTLVRVAMMVLASKDESEMLNVMSDLDYMRHKEEAGKYAIDRNTLSGI